MMALPVPIQDLFGRRQRQALIAKFNPGRLPNCFESDRSALASVDQRLGLVDTSIGGNHALSRTTDERGLK
jgi:hypothetical protein